MSAAEPPPFPTCGILSLPGYWEARTDALSFRVSATLSYDPNTIPAGLPESTLTLWGYSFELGDWEAFPTTIDVNQHTATASNLDYLTTFVLGSPDRTVGSCTPPTAGLVAWWPFDRGLVDIWGDNVSVQTGSPLYDSGRDNFALRFDGIDDFVGTYQSDGLDVGQNRGFTLEAWILPENATLPQPLIEWNDGASTRFGVHVWLSAGPPYGDPGSVFMNIVDTNQSWHIIFSSGGLLQAGQFQHIAATFDKASGVARLYLNGAVIATGVFPTIVPETSLDLFFGARPGQHHRFVGRMDEMRVYDRALSESEIVTHAQLGCSGFCRPLTSSGRVPADQSDGSPLWLISPSPSEIHLKWGASCSSKDTDYIVYEGDLSQMYSHSPKFCTTGGLRHNRFVPSAGNTYYLVVPRSAQSQGSLGSDSAMTERPPLSTCVTPRTSPCP